MPQLGETVTEGTITRWLKQPGDPVAVDDALAKGVLRPATAVPAKKKA